MKKKSFLSSDSPASIMRGVEKLLTDTPDVIHGDVRPLVKQFLERKQLFLDLAKRYPTPFYVLDSEALQTSIDSFSSAFMKFIPSIHVYFAMKTNNHPFILKSIVKNGWGIDISSTREFDLALAAGCHDILFTGPGKTVADLSYVLERETTTIINMDSFGELERLGEVTNRMKLKVRAGIRIYPSVRKTWTKFGIPLKDLARFWQLGKKYPYVDLQGIQFHLSWNEDSSPYLETIAELSTYLQKNFSKADLKTIRFIDFGGGFRPYHSEGKYPWLVPQGSVIKTVNDYLGKSTEFADNYFISPSLPITQFAEEIGKAIKEDLDPYLSCIYYTEPGRIISNNSMHALFRVIDKKSHQTVIVDGGINMIGWERFEFEYFPIINFSQPSLDEKECTFYGPLCDPGDVWGHYYYGKAVSERDICMVPNQGCLTYTLAQNFIRPIPEVYVL